MNRLLDWFDDRTGYKSLLHEALYERIPGGSRWRYVWGSTLVFTFSVQVITGFFLWMAYSPGSQTAWESVYYIQHEMQFGWLLRGLHHFTAQAMIVLLALHLMQVIIDGAYKAPREVNFWLGLILLQIVIGLSLTGYLLPWDQKGYWATKVSTNLAAIVPVIGPDIQRLVVGGPNYGHHTLTRFFAMHAGVLPALLIAFLGLHMYAFRRHGITVHDATRNPDTTFWPDQVLKDAVACLGVLMVVLVLVFWAAPFHQLSQHAANGHLGDVLGADLGAPADPAENYKAARPEWYFLFLFQFLKYFPGETEIFGAIIIPGLVFGLMFLMPFIGRWKFGHRFNIVYMLILLIGAGGLTWRARYDDQHGENAEDYKLAVEDAEMKKQRLIELIRGPQGIGKPGAVELLRSDPKTRGPKVFARNCSQCHRFDGHDGTGRKSESAAAASDLGSFGTRKYIRRFITNPAGEKQFGATVRGMFKGEQIGTRFSEGQMAEWAADNVEGMTKQEIDGVVEFLISQGKRSDIAPADPKLVEVGRNFWLNGSDNVNVACSECHGMTVNGEQLSESVDSGYPDLTDYASDEGLRDFILNPGSDRHYGENNAMRTFKGQMSDKDLEIVVRWMRHDWYEPDQPAKSDEEH